MAQTNIPKISQIMKKEIQKVYSRKPFYQHLLNKPKLKNNQTPKISLIPKTITHTQPKSKSVKSVQRNRNFQYNRDNNFNRKCYACCGAQCQQQSIPKRSICDTTKRSGHSINNSLSNSKIIKQIKRLPSSRQNYKVPVVRKVNLPRYFNFRTQQPSNSTCLQKGQMETIEQEGRECLKRKIIIKKKPNVVKLKSNKIPYLPPQQFTSQESDLQCNCKCHLNNKRNLNNKKTFDSNMMNESKELSTEATRLKNYEVKDRSDINQKFLSSKNNLLSLNNQNDTQFYKMSSINIQKPKNSERIRQHSISRMRQSRAGQQQKKFKNLSQEQILQILKNHQFQNPDLSYPKLINLPNFKIINYKNALYFGGITNQKKHGIGLLLYGNGKKFEGQYYYDHKVNGYQTCQIGKYIGEYGKSGRQGKGSFKYNNGQIYDGEWKKNVKHGSGIWKGIKGDTYIGQWHFGIIQGMGVHTWINGDKYEGEFKNFLKDGHGYEIFSNGDQYQGQYRQGKPDGSGCYRWKNNDSFNGKFSKGIRVGYGIMSYNNGQIYKGQFLNDLKHGYGQMKYKDGNFYKGEFRFGRKTGPGIVFLKNGRKLQGYWKDDVLYRQEKTHQQSIFQ